jgi:hypothetical protein
VLVRSRPQQLATARVNRAPQRRLASCMARRQPAIHELAQVSALDHSQQLSETYCNACVPSMCGQGSGDLISASHYCALDGMTHNGSCASAKQLSMYALARVQAAPSRGQSDTTASPQML